MQKCRYIVFNRSNAGGLIGAGIPRANICIWQTNKLMECLPFNNEQKPVDLTELPSSDEIIITCDYTSDA